MSILDNGELKDDQYCFACGQHNPHGLGMRVEYPEPEALCRITLDRRWQGWSGIAHGGVTATLLDEIMAHAVIRYVGQAVTINAQMRYRKPVPLDRELVVRGWVTETNGRRAKAAARLELADQPGVLAQAEAVFLLSKS